MDAITIEFGAFGLLCFACGYLLGKLHGMMTQIEQPPLPVAWIDKDGNPQGRVSDEQLIAVFCDAIGKCEKRSGLAPPPSVPFP